MLWENSFVRLFVAGKLCLFILICKLCLSEQVILCTNFMIISSLSLFNKFEGVQQFKKAVGIFLYNNNKNIKSPPTFKTFHK